MKKVLIISYYFPPMGMGGVQRVTKFVRYLPDFGWEPVVLTVRDVVYYARDDSLLNEVRGRRVIRTDSLDPLRILWEISKRKKKGGTNERGNERLPFFEKFNRILSSWICVPDSKVLWLPFLIMAAGRFLRSHDVDLILTTSPPHSAHLAGLWLKRKTGLPWVVDFRDNWFGDISEKSPTRVHRLLNRWMAHRVARSADCVVTVSEPITNDLALQSGRASEDCITLPNGYDKSDFEGIRSLPAEKFTITYCGTLSPVLNPKVFLRAVADAVRTRPDLKKRLCIRFVGTALGIDLSGIVHRYGLKGVVECVGYVHHRESIRYLMNSDMLFLTIRGDMGEGMITGKIFEYLASGKPILAEIPKGEAEKLILNYARGVVVPPADEMGMTAQILRAFALWERGDLKVTVPRWKGIECFDRRNQAKKLAEIFDAVVCEK
jgi:glycosyltransferase involved in cell wall biosynthesis